MNETYDEQSYLEVTIQIPIPPQNERPEGSLLNIQDETLRKIVWMSSTHFMVNAMKSGLPVSHLGVQVNWRYLHLMAGGAREVHLDYMDKVLDRIETAKQVNL